MSLLVLKLTVTPLAIGLITLFARRFGEAFGAWIAALPFTSAPVVLFLALDHGAGFATDTSLGVLAGTASQAAFALAYAWAATRMHWPFALIAGIAGFALCTIGLQTLTFSTGSALLIVAGAVLLALTLLPSVPRQTAPPPTSPPVGVVTDVALRALLATAVVAVITSLAPRIGPTLAGLVSPFPLFATIFIVFPHRRIGSVGAVVAIRGFLYGLFACAAFFGVASALLPGSPLAVVFSVAVASALLVQACTLALIRRGSLLAGVD